MSTSDYKVPKENVIEWYNDEVIATVTFNQRKEINNIKRLARDYPELIQDMQVNRDGSIYAHIPSNWISIRPKRKAIPEDQRNKLANDMRENKASRIADELP